MSEERGINTLWCSTLRDEKGCVELIVWLAAVQPVYYKTNMLLRCRSEH